MDIIPLDDGTQEGDRVYIYVHIKCAVSYREKEKKQKQEITGLEEEILRLGYLAGAARGKGTCSINQWALLRQRRLKRQLFEKLQGPGWTTDQWQALKRKYHYRCVCCRKKGLMLEPDHVDPIDKGGAHHISNIQPLCNPCNMRKGARYADYRPKDVRKWERDIRGPCRFGISTSEPCKRLAVEGGNFCTVDQ